MIWLLGIVVLVALVPAFIFLSLLPAWIQAASSKVPLTPLHVVGMVLRRVDARMLIERAVLIHKAGLPVDVSALEAHHLAGGDVSAVVDAAVSASKAGLPFDFYQIAAIDLAGRDVLQAVDAAVSPAVLRCPKEAGKTIRGVAKDGVRMSVAVRITVRSDLAKLVGGAGAETVLARVGQGIVAAIGTVQSHQQILERPALITSYILEHGLGTGTVFEIVSVDIEHVGIEDNVGARLRDEQATADKLVSQAHAESRRAMGVAREFEMRARVKEKMIIVAESEVEVPGAMAQALQSGHVWRAKDPVAPTTAVRPWDASELATSKHFR